MRASGAASIHRIGRGDVQFIGRGVKHDAKNTSGKPVDSIIVAIG